MSAAMSTDEECKLMVRVRGIPEQEGEDLSQLVSKALSLDLSKLSIKVKGRTPLKEGSTKSPGLKRHVILKCPNEKVKSEVLGLKSASGEVAVLEHLSDSEFKKQQEEMKLQKAQRRSYNKSEAGQASKSGPSVQQQSDKQRRSVVVTGLPEIYWRDDEDETAQSEEYTVCWFMKALCNATNEDYDEMMDALTAYERLGRAMWLGSRAMRVTFSTEKFKKDFLSLNSKLENLKTRYCIKDDLPRVRRDEYTD